MKAQGSGTILVFSLISLIGLLIMLFTKSTALFHTFALERMRYAQNQLALNALMEYAVAICSVKNIENSWSSTLEHWPDEKSTLLGRIEIVHQGQDFHIVAQLTSHETVLGKVMCCVRHVDGKYTIRDWITQESG